MPKWLPNLIINRVKFDTRDFSDFAKSLTYFCHCRIFNRSLRKKKTEKHKTGVYFHAVPEHPITGHSTLDYKKQKTEDTSKLIA